MAWGEGVHTLRAARRAWSSLLAPVQTILPEAKMSAVVLGSLMRTMQAAKRLGLYSAFLACMAMVLSSSGQPKLSVATTFCSWGMMPEGCLFTSTAGPMGLAGALATAPAGSAQPAQSS